MGTTKRSQPKDGRPRRVTVREVAQAAGVSVGTVSLALADNPVVNEATRAHVRAVAAELHYSPSALGRALQAQRTNAVALVVPHSGEHVFSHFYFMEMLTGISRVLNDADMTLVLSTSPTEHDESAAFLKILRSQQVDGIILASAALHDKNISRLALSGHPYVFVGRYPLDPDVPAVGIDDQDGARQAVRHLLAHGHTRIAHISGPAGHLSAADRYDGYREALREARVPVIPEYLYEGDYSEEAGRRGMAALLALPEPPTALFAGSDETAVGACAVLAAAGILPGPAFPVVGFDDVVLARLVAPPLTTVRQPMRELGAEAARLLLALLRGETPAAPQTVLPVSLVLRASCGCGDPGQVAAGQDGDPLLRRSRLPARSATRARKAAREKGGRPPTML